MPWNDSCTQWCNKLFTYYTVWNWSRGKRVKTIFTWVKSFKDGMVIWPYNIYGLVIVESVQCRRESCVGPKPRMLFGLFDCHCCHTIKTKKIFHAQLKYARVFFFLLWAKWRGNSNFVVWFETSQFNSPWFLISYRYIEHGFSYTRLFNCVHHAF